MARDRLGDVGNNQGGNDPYDYYGADHGDYYAMEETTTTTNQYYQQQSSRGRSNGSNNNNNYYTQQQPRTASRTQNAGQGRYPPRQQSSHPPRGQSNNYQHNNNAYSNAEQGNYYANNKSAKTDDYYYSGEAYPQSMSDNKKKGGSGDMHNQVMQSFMADVESVKIGISKVKDNMNIMENLHKKALNATSPEEKTRAAKQIDAYQEDCSTLISQLRTMLKHMQTEATTKLQGSDSKICVTQTQGLAKKMMDVAQDYQRMQMKFKEKYKQRLEREVRVANPYATEQEVYQAVENGGSGFAMQMMSSSAAQRDALRDVQIRHDEIMNIEKSVTELFELFQEMQHLLVEQQEAINIIDSHVDAATEHLDNGNQQMSKAIVHRKKSRKRMWWIFFCILILLIVAGVFLYIKLRK